jgi:tripartite-type tricarboxylate transporter receptor subunit TctC
VLLAALCVLNMSTAWCQRYPNKPVRVVTSEPGGSNDFVARTISQAVTPALGQQFVVDNRGGASGAFAGQLVAKSLPDGYTLLLYSSGFWVLPLLQDMPYDPVRDFSPVILIAKSPNLLVVHPSLPVVTVKELVAMAKSTPGRLNYASGGLGTTLHLSAELFKSMAGVDIVHVPYKGAGPALNSLIAGQVQLMFATAGGAIPHVRAGKLKALAVTTIQPSPLLTGLPTLSESGLTGYDSGTSYGVWAPARTADSVIRALNQAVMRCITSQETKERLLNAGLTIIGGSPKEFAVGIVSEMAVWRKVIKDAGIRIE